jgi:BirA family biotin operon repressor/biotin-[acetyl-CoA-carboxylase] ligase
VAIPADRAGTGGGGAGGGSWVDLDRPPLSAPALRRALLAPAGPLTRLEVVARAGSTNADLLAAAADPVAWPDLSALVADHQARGRGRSGRAWHTPPRAAVTASLLLRPASPPPSWSWLPLLAGLGVVRALRDVAGVPAALKWPNDVLVAEPDAGPDPRPDGPDAPEGSGGEGGPGGEPVHGLRKVAGVLVEVAGPAVAVGVGVNVTQGRDELPVPTATSLRLAGSATTDRDTVTRAVLRSVAAQYERWRAAGGDAVAAGIADAVRESCVTLGRSVRVHRPGGSVLQGVAEGIDDDGRLLLRSPGGVDHAVSAGDVEHLRDALP